MLLTKKRNWKEWSPVQNKKLKDENSFNKYEIFIKNLKDLLFLCMLEKTVFRDKI